jgi:hypothetical protein
MSQHYSDQNREAEEHALPDLETFELDAREAAALDDDMAWEYTKRPEFRLATMDSKVREEMFATMIEEQGITGGWFYWFCFPGCLPDGPPFGPFESERDALRDARDNDDEVQS